MTKGHDPNERSAGVRQDLEALKSATGRSLPALPHVVARARSQSRADSPGNWKENLMSTAMSVKQRPWLAMAGVAAVLALVLLAVPISYERTTGQEVRLTLSGASLDPAGVATIAKELKTALRASGVTAAMESNDGAQSLTFTANVPGSSLARAQAVAQTFATSLGAKGYQVTASARSIRERVSTSVYAYARDQVIQISLDDKSAPELEAEIRQRLVEAGIPDAVVSVSDEMVNGKPAQKVRVEMKRDHSVSSPEEAARLHEAGPEIVFTKDGQPVAGQGTTVRVAKKNMHGSITTSIEVQSNGRTFNTEIPNSEGLSDAALGSAIEDQLRQAGLNARVTVTNGQIDIQPEP